MNVVIYARVSTTRQAEKDLSIPDQLKQARAHCKRMGWHIVDEYVEAGASATSDRRPVFQQMIEDAERKPRCFDVILIHSLSRIYRDSIELGMLERRLKKLGVRIESVTQQTTNDPAGQLARQMFSMFDEYQSAENAKHTLRAMKENARQGFFNGSTPPFGFAVEETDLKGRHSNKKRLVVCESEAETVRMIFEMYCRGVGGAEMGMKEVASYLNARGIFRRGKQWGRGRIGDVLADRTYIGEYYFNKVCGKTKEQKPEGEWIRLDVPALVSEALFSDAAVRRTERRPDVTPPRVLTSPTLLTGLLRCGDCGASMTLATGKGGRYRYYKCTNRINKRKDYCGSRNVRMEVLDEAVLAAVAEKVCEPSRLHRALKVLMTSFSENQKATAGRADNLRKRLAENHARSARLFEAVETGVLPNDVMVQERSRKLSAERQELQLKIARLSAAESMPVVSVTPARVAKFTDALRSQLMNPASRLCKRYVKALLESVTLVGDAVEVRGRYAPALAGLAAYNEKAEVVVPTSALEWLPGTGSNRRPSD